MKIQVISRFYSDHTDAWLKPADEDAVNYAKQTKEYDEYSDLFDSLDKAMKYVSEVLAENDNYEKKDDFDMVKVTLSKNGKTTDLVYKGNYMKPIKLYTENGYKIVRIVGINAKA